MSSKHAHNLIFFQTNLGSSKTTYGQVWEKRWEKSCYCGGSWKLLKFHWAPFFHFYYLQDWSKAVDWRLGTQWVFWTVLKAMVLLQTRLTYPESCSSVMEAALLNSRLTYSESCRSVIEAALWCLRPTCESCCTVMLEVLLHLCKQVVIL